ncbi:MAG TPA: hypothetical protein PLO52_00485 [Flavobacterium alvei]|nr:hypothetical protein [Flavobacterium alvei]
MTLDLVLGGVILVLIFVLYQLAVYKGKSDEKIKQLGDIIEAGNNYQTNSEKRISTYDKNIGEFNAEIDNTDYATADDATLTRLHKGQTSPSLSIDSTGPRKTIRKPSAE